MAKLYGVYSFQDVVATITGPGGGFPLGVTAGPSEEGIEIEKTDANTKTIGADGTGMHSMHADESGTLSVTLLKTSPTNALLSALYAFQKASSINWGQNTIVIVEIVTGDVITAGGVAFKKHSKVGYKTVGGNNVWEFEAIEIDDLLGTGTPEIA